jgi:purine nucleoside permease
MKKGISTTVILAMTTQAPLLRAEKYTDERIPIRVVVVTAFEPGKDEGDIPGELQNWVERLPLPTVLPFPQGNRHLRYNSKKQVLGVVAGEGPSRMASSITALANDPRFDCRRAYWILVGVAGVDPNVSTVASAAWARYVVDGDLAYEIDAREIPPNWQTGYVPFGRGVPNQSPTPPAASESGTNQFTLNSGLADWAYQHSLSHVTLADDEKLQALRAQYVGFPNAQHPPTIIEGDVIAAATYWLGGLLNTWAEKWVDYWTSHKGVFTMSAEEDSAYMEALTFLSRVNKVDLRRVMILRSGSDFTVPPPGKTAAELLLSEINAAGMTGYTESLDSAYQAGSSVVTELSSNWKLYRDHIPGGKVR